jgi:hypothetical protein
MHHKEKNYAPPPPPHTDHFTTKVADLWKIPKYDMDMASEQDVITPIHLLPFPIISSFRCFFYFNGPIIILREASSRQYQRYLCSRAAE